MQELAANTNIDRGHRQDGIRKILLRIGAKTVLFGRTWANQPMSNMSASSEACR